MAAKSLRHKFVNAVADSADTTITRPTNWNADHDFYLGINPRTGNYTVLDTDIWSLITYTNAAAITATLPQAGAASQFLSGHVTFHRNLGAGELTIQPTTSTINGKSALILAQGQEAIVRSDGSNYSAAVHEAGVSPETTVASAATCDIGDTLTSRVAISGTTTIASFGTKPDRIRFIRFTAALILTHNASSLILPGGQNITTDAGATGIAISDSAGNWRLWGYTPGAVEPGRLKSKVFNISRDLAAPSGSVSYVGVGYKPTSLTIVGAIIGASISGVLSLADSSGNGGAIVTFGSAGTWGSTTKPFAMYIDSTNYQEATITSYDDDGFTLLWLKNNTPTGTASFYVKAER